MTAKARLVATALVLAACHEKRQASATADTLPSEQTVGAVGTAVAATQPFPQIISAIGTVTPRPAHFAELSAPAPTRVARLFVTPGQRVAEGDSLVEFERAPFDAAARSAETALASAERAYARAVRLAQAGILPQKDSDQAGADLAQAQVAAVTARRAQQLATLRAPIAGVVTRMTAVLGASVDATQPLVEVADVAALDAVFNVSPAQAGQIHGGDSVHVTAGEGEGGEVVGQGTVTAVGAAVDSSSRAVAGVWAAFLLPSAIYPELEFSRIKIVAQGSTLGARQVVFSVTRPLEEAVSVVPGVTRVQSHSIRGASEIAITFAPRTDMAYALQLVRARVGQIQAGLPADLEIEIERLAPSLFPILSYNLEGGDPATLYDIARYEIKPLISRVPGVGRVDVQGTDVREIEVVADPTRLAALGLTYPDVADAIRRAVTVQAVGRVAQDYRQFLIVTDQEAHGTEDIGGVVLANGLRVRDVATVRLGTEDHVRIVAGDGKPAALSSVTRQVNGNTLAVADSVAGIVASLAHGLPPGVTLKGVYDQAALVRDAVRSVRDAMVVGALLAVLVLLPFRRHGRIPAHRRAAIPLTLGLTVFLMWVIGQTFNLMTLGAMAIAIGLVIDDAVVVTENIARHLRLDPGASGRRLPAIRAAVQELIWPVTTSTITTVVVFLPLGLLQGVVGQFFAALATTLTVAVLVSLALALTLIPLLAEQFVTPHDVAATTPRWGPLARLETALDALAPRYARALGTVLRNPRRVAVCAVVLVAMGAALWRTVGTGFPPEIGEGAFVLDYFTPGGTALAETNRQVGVAERILAGTPEITGTSRRTGAELGMFATAQNSGDIVVRLAPPGRRSRDVFAVIDDVRGRIEAAVPRLHIEFMQILADVINDLAGAARPVEIKLYGEPLDTLEAYARRLAPELERIPGLEDLYDGVSEPTAELLMRVHQAESDRIGMTPADVGNTVAAAPLGAAAGEIRVEGRPVG